MLGAQGYFLGCQLGARGCLASPLSCDFNMIKSYTHDCLISSLLITPPVFSSPTHNREPYDTLQSDTVAIDPSVEAVSYLLSNR